MCDSRIMIELRNLRTEDAWKLWCSDSDWGFLWVLCRECHRLGLSVTLLLQRQRGFQRCWHWIGTWSTWPFNWCIRIDQELFCSCAWQWFQGVRTLRLGLWLGIVYDQDIVDVDSKEERLFLGNEDTRIEVTWIQDWGSRSRGQQTGFVVRVWGRIESEDLRRRMQWGCSEDAVRMCAMSKPGCCVLCFVESRSSSRFLL